MLIFKIILLECPEINAQWLRGIGSSVFRLVFVSLFTVQHVES